MMPYMTTHSVTSFDHDAIYDNDGILGLVPNLIKASVAKELVAVFMAMKLMWET